MGTLKHDGPPPERVRILLSAGKRDPDVREWLWRHVRSAQSEIRAMIRERIAAEGGQIVPESLQGRLPTQPRKEPVVPATPPTPPVAAPSTQPPRPAPVVQSDHASTSTNGADGEIQPGSPGAVKKLHALIADMNKAGRAADE